MIHRKVSTILSLFLGVLLLCGNVTAIGEGATTVRAASTKPSSAQTSYQTTCKCRALPASSGSKCYVFVNSGARTCRYRRCKPSYVCDSGRGTKICRWTVSKTTIVKDGYNTCKTIKQVTKKLTPVGQAPTYEPTPTGKPSQTVRPSPTVTPTPTVQPTTKPGTYSLLKTSKIHSSKVVNGSASAVTLHPHYTKGFSASRCLRTYAARNPYWMGYFSRAMTVYRVYLTPSRPQFSQMKSVSVYAGGYKCRLLTSLARPVTRVVYQCVQKPVTYIRVLRGGGKTLEFCGVDVYGRYAVQPTPTVKPTTRPTYSLMKMSKYRSTKVTGGSTRAVSIRPHYTKGFSASRCLRTYATKNPYWMGYFSRATAVYRVYLTPSKAQFAQMKAVSVYAGGYKCKLLTSLAKPTTRVIYQCVQKPVSYIRVLGGGKTLEFCGVDVYGRYAVRPTPTVKPTTRPTYSLLKMSKYRSTKVTGGSTRAVSIRPHYTKGFSASRCLRTYATKNPYWMGYFSRATAVYRVYLTPSKAQFAQMKTMRVYAGGYKCRLLTSLAKPTTRVIYQCVQKPVSYIRVLGGGKTLEFCGVDVYGRYAVPPTPTVKPTTRPTYSLLKMSKYRSTKVTGGSTRAVSIRPHYTKGFSASRCLRTYATKNPYWMGYFSRATAVYRVYLTPSKAQFAQMKAVSVYAGGYKCKLLTSLAKPTTRVIYQCVQKPVSYIRVLGGGKTLEFCGVDVYGRYAVQPTPTVKPTTRPTYSLLKMSKYRSTKVTGGSTRAVSIRPHYTKGFSASRCLRTYATKNPYWMGYFSRATAVYRVYLTPSKAQFAQMKTLSVYAGGYKCKLLTSLAKPTTRVIYQCVQKPVSYIRVLGGGKTLEFCGVDVYGRYAVQPTPTVKPTTRPTYSLMKMSKYRSTKVTGGSTRAVSIRPHYTKGFSASRCLRTYATKNPYWMGYFSRATAVYRVYLTPSKAQFAQMKTMRVYAGGYKCRLLTSLAKPTTRVIYQCVQKPVSYIRVLGGGKTLEFCGVDVYGRYAVTPTPTVKPTTRPTYSLLKMSKYKSTKVTGGSTRAVSIRPHYTKGFSASRCLRTYATKNPYWMGYFSRATAVYRVYLTPSKAQFAQMKTLSVYMRVGTSASLLTSLAKPTTRVIYQCVQKPVSYIRVLGGGKTLEFCGVDVYGRYVVQPTPAVKPTTRPTYSLMKMSKYGSTKVTGGSSSAVSVRPHYTKGFSASRCLRTYATKNPYWMGYFSRATTVYYVYLTPSKVHFAQMKTVSVYAGGYKCRLLTSLAKPVTRVIYQCAQKPVSYIRVLGGGTTLEFCGVDVYGRMSLSYATPMATTKPTIATMKPTIATTKPTMKSFF